MSAFKVETGFQLFSRLNTRPTIENIHPDLFPNGGPKAKEVVEIMGETSTGKTLIITDLIARCLLPQEYSGKNAGVILLNTEHHFQLTLLVKKLKMFLKINPDSSDKEIDAMVQLCLRNLLILDIFDSQQLYLTLNNFDCIMTNHNRISLVILDSLPAFYWSDRLLSDIKSIDTYQKTILKLFQKKIQDFNAVIVYSKHTAFNSKKDNLQLEKCSANPALEKINYRILLQKNDTENESFFCAQLTMPNNKTIVKKYRIEEKSDIVSIVFCSDVKD